MVAPGRFELPTSGLGNRCSIQLSYGAVASKYSRFNTLQPFVEVSVLRCKRPFPKTSFAYATRSGQAAREGMEGNSELLEARAAFTSEGFLKPD